MPIELKMPALSPTMEEGTLAKWLVKEGDDVKSGDILAEIETDKATMEFEAVDEGKIAKILVPEGTDGVKVGAPIAILAGEGEDASAAAKATPKQPSPPRERVALRSKRRVRGVRSLMYPLARHRRKRPLKRRRPRLKPPPPLPSPLPRGEREKGSKPRRSQSGSLRPRTSTSRPSRAAALAAASSAPMSMRRPERLLRLLRLAPPPQRPRSARTSSCPA